MHVIGELKDKKMAEEIMHELHDQGILASIHHNAELDIYILLLDQEAQLELARDFFRIKLGFQKPQKIDEEWVKIKTIPKGDSTIILLSICVGIYILSFTNLGDSLYRLLFIGNVESGFLEEVKRGQVWRLITPAFLHMSLLHILFNMLWFKDLGYLLEFSFGKNFLLLFVFSTALFSNLFQYFVGGPQFGGMSGVLYAMLGFIWVFKNINTDFAYSLPRYDITIMIGWYFLCLTGLLGPIANTAHGMGLVSGILIASFMNFKWQKIRLKYISVAIFFFVFTLIIEGYKLDGRYYFLINR